MPKQKVVSFIIPVFNEEENIRELYTRIKAVVQDLSFQFKFIFVDDGSDDRSWESISSLSEQDDAIIGLSLSRNFGHQSALSAGLDHVDADAVIMMDADLQHPPELIPQLIDQWQNGFDVVYTVRQEAKDYSWLKKTCSNMFYWLWNRCSGVNIPAGTADFRLLSKRAYESLQSLTERTRFLRGMVGWIGYPSVEVPYKADARHSGKTKYSFGKMLRFSLSGITSFTSGPLYFAAVLGGVISLLSFLYGLYAIYMKFFTDIVIPGWTSILVSVLFLGGIQLFAVGILGEYIAKIYEEVKQRPMYIIREHIGAK